MALLRYIEKMLLTLEISYIIKVLRSYTEVNELTPEILNSFIDKIYIGKPERINGQRVQEVKIVYKLVGAVNIPQ